MSNQPIKGPVVAALEFSRLQSLFSAIINLASDAGNHDGDVINLLEIGEAYAGQLSQKYDDLAAAEKKDNQND